MKIDEIVEDVEATYGSLTSPRLSPSILDRMESMDTTKHRALLKRIADRFEEDFEPNADRSACYRVFDDAHEGIVMFSIVGDYIAATEPFHSRIGSILSAAKGTFVDHKTLEQSLAADTRVDEAYFAFDPPVTISNLLFADYDIDWSGTSGG